MNILILGLGKTGTTALTYGVKQRLSDHEIIFEPKDITKINYNQNNNIIKLLKVNQCLEKTFDTEQFDKKILIVRHPFDRIISYLLYKPYASIGFSSDKNVEKYLTLIKEKIQFPNKINTLEIIELYELITNTNMLKSIVKEHNCLLQVYQNFSNEFCIVKYEDFVDRNIFGLEQYLNINFDENIEVSKKYKRVERSKDYGEWKNWFTTHDLEKLLPYCMSFISCFGYSFSLDEQYIKKINNHTSYLYTLNIINEFRNSFCLPNYEFGKIKIEESEGLLIDRAIKNLRSNNLEKAEKDIRHAIEIASGIAGSYVVLGKILARRNKFDDAELAFDDALQTFSKKINYIKHEQKKVRREKRDSVKAEIVR